MSNFGKEDSKYCVPVYTVATVSKFAGNIYCNSVEELQQLFNNNNDNLFDNGYISGNCTNDFDIGDTNLEDLDLTEDELEKYYQRK